jgi:hypothetical protein
MTPFVKKSLLGIVSAIFIILLIDFLEASHHLLTIALITVILGVAIGIAYDLGENSE